MNNILTVHVGIIHDGNSLQYFKSNVYVVLMGMTAYLNINNSTTGNHTITVVKGKEEYQLLNTGLANVISEVNSVCREGAVEVKGKKVKI